jgi:hypothetical protein
VAVGRCGTPKLLERLTELFEKGLGPRAAHAAVAKQASYGTVYKVYREWTAGRSASTPAPGAAEPAQPALALIVASDTADAVEEAPSTAPAAAPTKTSVRPVDGTAA